MSSSQVTQLPVSIPLGPSRDIRLPSAGGFRVILRLVLHNVGEETLVGSIVISRLGSLLPSAPPPSQSAYSVCSKRKCHSTASVTREDGLAINKSTAIRGRVAGKGGGQCTVGQTPHPNALVTRRGNHPSAVRTHRHATDRARGSTSKIFERSSAFSIATVHESPLRCVGCRAKRRTPLKRDPDVNARPDSPRRFGHRI